MENIRTYEDMENYVRNQIENSWDFVDKDLWKQWKEYELDE